jgi:hypothetical protein
VALLKLEPKAAAPAPTPGLQCCTVCTLPMPPGMHRCPASAPVEPLVQPVAPTTP